MKNLIFYFINLFLCFSGYSQTIRGELSLMVGESIQLYAFNGFSTYKVSVDTIDSKGRFELLYLINDYGIGYLIIGNTNPIVVILNGEEIEIKGSNFKDINNVVIIKGFENQKFQNYAKQHSRNEQIEDVWRYLYNMYSFDSIYSNDNSTRDFIFEQCNKFKQVDQELLNQIKPGSYLAWYLSVRGLVTRVSKIAQFQSEEIPTTIASFREIDYSDERLYRSGLLKDLLESHFWLLENSSMPLEEVFKEMKISIDSIIVSLVKNEDKLNEVSEFLFKMFEQHSLFNASEYLALSLLNTQSCCINKKLINQFEHYRNMKIGSIASDIEFTSDLHAPNYINTTHPKSLSDLDSDYYIIMFGASWCSKCVEDIRNLYRYYPKWKHNGLEVIFIALEENPLQFKNFVAPFPFISICDYKKWESPHVVNYYVFATPTYYLLNKNREILLRPKSVEQINAWVDWYLLQENK